MSRITLLVFSAVALAAAQRCPEPAEGEDRCECHVGPPSTEGPQVWIFDFEESQDVAEIAELGATRLVEYDPDPQSPCRFRLDAFLRQTDENEFYVAFARFRFGPKQVRNNYPNQLRFGGPVTKYISKMSGSRVVTQVDLKTDGFTADGNEDFTVSQTGRHILLTSQQCNLSIDYKKSHPFDEITICATTSPDGSTANPGEFVGKCGNCNNELDDDDYYYEAEQ